MIMEADETLEATGSSVRREHQRQQDKKRMAFRRAIEEYRASQALQAQFCDYPELLGGAYAGHQRRTG